MCSSLLFSVTHPLLVLIMCKATTQPPPWNFCTSKHPPWLWPTLHRVILQRPHVLHRKNHVHRWHQYFRSRPPDMPCWTASGGFTVAAQLPLSRECSMDQKPTLIYQHVNWRFAFWVLLLATWILWQPTCDWLQKTTTFCWTTFRRFPMCN